MKKQINVKIPFRLFGLLVLYFLEDCRDDDIEREIYNELNAKNHALMRHQEYSEAIELQKALENRAE